MSNTTQSLINRLNVIANKTDSKSFHEMTLLGETLNSLEVEYIYDANLNKYVILTPFIIPN